MHLKELTLLLTGRTRVKKKEMKKERKKERKQATVPKEKKLAQTGKGSCWIALGESCAALNKPAGGNEGFKWHANGLPLKEKVSNGNKQQ